MSPSARRSPPTTSGRRASRARRIIVQDPRITPIARTCDLFLPVKPGRDAALFAGVLHMMIEHGWIDRDVHRCAHGRLRPGRRLLPAWTLARTAEVTGVPERSLRRPPNGGARRRRASCSTRAASSTTPTACRTRSARSTSCSPRAASASRKSGYGTIVGQANGQGGREHGQKCDQLPGLARHREPRAPQVHRRRLGHRRSGSARARASTPTRCSARSTRARSRD